ncbi:kinase-like protein [Penicillium sp. CMV-2018d]|nr:kinase-like protein [Penicillium sp. CMV-2018d]
MQPPLAVFEHMGLVVKWGVLVNIHEAQSTYAVYHLLNGRVPVPEVFGWRTDGDEKFIYMQYVQGQTLEEAWDSLQPTDRDIIVQKLRMICDNLRQLEQDPSDKFIGLRRPNTFRVSMICISDFLLGNVMRTSIYDRVFSLHTHEAGPFTTVQEFHDWFTFLCRKRMRDPHSVPTEPFRYDLPDDSAIKFTQGDLHRSNIIISFRNQYRVLAIVDWEQSGWLPEYWEARKMEWTVSDKEWAKYPPLILDQYKSTVEAWWWYTASLGC